MDILINLLPPIEKDEIRNMRRVGIVLKIGLAAVCAIVVFLVFLFFTMKAILIQEEAVADEIIRFEQSESYREVKEAQDSLREYNKTASRVKSGLSNQNQRWELISRINQIVPGDVMLIEFSIDEGNVLKLNGIAYTREALLALKGGLESCGQFSKVESPISNFVSDKDIDFEFTAEVE